MGKKINPVICGVVVVALVAAIVFFDVYVSGPSPSARATEGSLVITPIKVRFETSGGQVEIDAETADLPEEHQRGLMYRESMPENYGMIFIFFDTQERSFWMKNTLIPLDMIFISSNRIVVDMKENFQPCTDSCPVYLSKPARYVIEVNAGFAGRHGIEIGDMVDF